VDDEETLVLGSFPARAAGAVLVLFACRPAAPPPVLAPVPDESQRLELATPAAPLSAADVQDILDAVTCLAGSNGREARRCATEATRASVPSCTTKDSAMAEPLRPLVAALATLELTTLDSALATLPQRFPAFEVTARNVRDARRAARCDTWGSEAGRPRKCVGLRAGEIWVLLTAPPGARTGVDSIAVFLGSAGVCEDALRPGSRAP
jgi:hypothetical protein